jgi:hypothetical protein
MPIVIQLYKKRHSDSGGSNSVGAYTLSNSMRWLTLAKYTVHKHSNNKCHVHTCTELLQSQCIKHAYAVLNNRVSLLQLLLLFERLMHSLLELNAQRSQQLCDLCY